MEVKESNRPWVWQQLGQILQRTILHQQRKAEPSLPNVKKNDPSKTSYHKLQRAVHCPFALEQKEHTYQGCTPWKVTIVRGMPALGREKQ